MDEPRLISAGPLREWSSAILARLGVPRADAALTAEILVDTSLRGVDTHGILQLKGYVEQLRRGEVNPTPHIEIKQHAPATALVDGDDGLGFVVGTYAMRQAIARARAAGVGVVSVQHSNHYGAAGYYARLAPPERMIGVSLTNAVHGVAPFGSRTVYLGTNPIAIAAPGGIPGGMVLDMATSQIAWNKVYLASLQGIKIPFGWASDRDGNPTDDPVRALEGFLLPLGGYKGSGLGLMVEILTGVLSGSHTQAGASRHAEDIAHFFMALDVARFSPIEEFTARMDEIAGELHACEPLNDGARVYVPGEIELEVAARRSREGIPLPPYILADLQELAAQFNLPLPSSTAPSIESTPE